MGSRVIMIAAADDADAKGTSRTSFRMPPDVAEPLTPFVYKSPFEHLSCQIAHEQKIPFLGFHNPKRQQVNFRQIFSRRRGDRQLRAQGSGLLALGRFVPGRVSAFMEEARRVRAMK